jgi:hypothetical protein
MVSLIPASLMSKIKLGQNGIVGTAVQTAILEFGTQALEKFVPQVRKVTDITLLRSAPFLNNVDVRDAIVLSPTIKEVTKFAGKGKPNFKNILVNYGMKVILRNSGLNPLPDVHTNPSEHKIKQYSQQLPARV